MEPNGKSVTNKAFPENKKPELWGGVECTINRIADSFRDQLHYSSHYTRDEDIEHFTGLGISRLRYPILWEKHLASEDQEIDWSWTAKQLERLKGSGIEPIAGLLHHGSGPSYTSLLDPSFPRKLASYAAKVAERFPWIKYYTPINEPLTTARFSGLYGFWYPHQTNEISFIKMLLNQLKGIVLSMAAIRKVNPDAVLIQTEDIGKTHSTEKLKYQADFENERRWLTYDILCGKFDPSHYFWKYFLKAGINEEELEFFRDNYSVPGIAGFNYYVTSERFLDEDLDKYPEFTHGGNYYQRYADTEAVRTGITDGIEKLLSEAWDRYGLPMAVTECHISCTREEQLRWFYETWQAACRLIQKDIPVTAVTAWALLGAFDWNSLLTREENHYETGAFDLRGGRPRATALAKMIKNLSNGNNYHHPLLLEPGWWIKNKKQTSPGNSKHRPCLIVGRNGTLATAFAKICEHRSIPIIALSRNEIDITDRDSIQRVIDQHSPWAIINTSGFVRVDDAELFPEECYSVNTTGPENMAAICREKGIRFMTFSSDLVFNGEKTNPYNEDDQVQPLNVYGASKAEAERKVMFNNPDSLVIRTSAFFGPWDRYNFIYYVLHTLKNEGSLPVAEDVIISPTYVPDLVNMALDLFIDEEQGIWHLSNEGSLSWAELAGEVAERNGFSKQKLLSIPGSQMEWKAKRPKYSALISGKGAKLSSLDSALARYFEECCV
jgi:dTDP-4-dehydrorhamnose reductase